MTRMTSGIVIAGLLAVLPATAGAQDVPDSMMEAEHALVGTTLSLFSGRMEGASTLPSETELTPGTAYGAALTHWSLPWFGLRARALYADQRIRGTHDPGLRKRLGDRENVVLAGGDFLLGRGLDAADLRLRPYLALGVGFKRYLAEKPWTDIAFNAGVGLEARFGLAGVFGEANRVVTDFDGTGRSEFAGEWLFTGGVTMRVPRP